MDSRTACGSSASNDAHQGFLAYWAAANRQNLFRRRNGNNRNKGFKAVLGAVLVCAAAHCLAQQLLPGTKPLTVKATSPPRWSLESIAFSSVKQLTQSPIDRTIGTGIFPPLRLMKTQ